MSTIQTPPKSPNSPGLEVISNGGSGSNENTDLREKRRLPRLSLTEEQFRISPLGKIFPVVDLSSGGMGIRVVMEEDLVLFSIGAKVEGILNLRRQKHPIVAKVRYLSGTLVGCEFQPQTSAETFNSLKKLLDPAALGAELKPIPSSESGPLWYHGPSGTDLLLWRKLDGEYRRLTLFVLGSFIQWDETDGLSSGTVNHSNDANESWGVVRFETMILNPDPKLDSGKQSIAKTLLLSSNLPEALKKWCSRRIEK